MKSFDMHTNSSKHSKRIKHRRNNAMKNAGSKDRIRPHIFNTYHINQNYDNVKQFSKNIKFINTIGLKTNYPKYFAPIYFSTQQAKSPKVKTCTEIMTLLPYNNKNRHQNVNNKIITDNSTLLARVTMNALAASETDVNAILELVETMYNSIQEMLQDLKQKQQTYKPFHNIVQEPKYVIKIDVKKFVKYLNDQYIRNTGNVLRNGNNQDLILRKEPCISKPSNMCRSFNVLLQPRRMSFNISVFKLNSCSMDFFQRLATFYNSCNMIYNTAKRKPVPSVFIRDWHFRNVSQGYLLSLLLKHSNVMSLNVMRKLYFVIITSVTPNLTIEINFKLTNGIFSAYDTPPFQKLPFQVIHWNDKHRNILETSSRILYTPAFTYNFSNKDEEMQRDTKSDNTLHNKSSSDSSSTLKYASSEYEGSDYFLKSTSYSEYGFLDLKSTESSTDLTLKESVKTLTLSIDDMLSFHALLNTRKDCGDMNFTSMLQEQYNMCHSTIQQSRTWMSKVCSDSAKLKAEVIAPYINSLLNETVFDRITLSIGGYVGAFTQYWTRFESQTFCKRVFKDLGNYLVHTMFISILYY